jgi:hypothetical protein
MSDLKEVKDEASTSSTDDNGITDSWCSTRVCGHDQSRWTRPAFWLSGADAGKDLVYPSGSAKVNNSGATIKVNATDLIPGHAYTMWVVYFNDSVGCEGAEGCNGPDLGLPDVDGGGVLFGNGQVAGGNGTATFTARLNTGDTADSPPRPPPFAFAPYEAGENNEFHVVIRSHGPTIPGEVGEQIQSYNGGCEVEVGPEAGQIGGDVPVLSGECGDVQLYIFG